MGPWGTPWDGHSPFTVREAEGEPSQNIPTETVVSQFRDQFPVADFIERLRHV